MRTISASPQRSLDPAAVRPESVRTRPNIVPPAPKIAPKPPARYQPVWVMLLVFALNIFIGFLVMSGVSSFIKETEKMEQDNEHFETAKNKAVALRQRRDAKARYIEEITKKNEYSPILLNEARERAGVRLESEHVLNLSEDP